jgi:myo-inositol-1(or 4)-monophosphatase
MADEHHRAAVTERAARAGGVVARGVFRGDLQVETKSNENDLVTQTDRDSQTQVVATVRQEFPEDAFLLEETPTVTPGPDGSASELQTVDAVPERGPVWIVDPIDGTANFVRGVSLWTTSVASVVDGDTVGSATYLPAVEDVYAAGPESVTRNGDPITVSERTDPDTFAVATVGWWDRTDRSVFAALCAAVVERFGDLRRLGSFQATLAHVAAGGLEGAIAPGPTRPWETVAGVHMVRRAGGTVTDAAGEP